MGPDIINSFKNGAGQLTLVDGDRIIVVICSVLKEMFRQIYGEEDAGVKIGVVQTAYANNGATNYIKKKLGVFSRISFIG